MMRTALTLLAFLFCSTPLLAQQRPIWERVYTFDESSIDMNTRDVVRTGLSTGRVKFRWIFSEAESYDHDPRIKYKSRLETIDFDCKENKYRPYDVAFLDGQGKVVAYEASFWLSDWRTGKAFYASTDRACELINPKPPPDKSSVETKKVMRFALAVSTELERAKDFQSVISRFFAPSYLDGYVRDRSTNWFVNLNQDVAEKARRPELERFYRALLNTGYLSTLYAVSRYQPSSSEIDTERLVPPDLLNVIRRHPYTATYGRGKQNFDYLAEKIEGVDQLRSYTDLLEKIDAKFLRYIKNMRLATSTAYQSLIKEGTDEESLYDPKVRICANECLGLPRGTRLFQVRVPVFELQVAEINGRLRVVSARNYF